LERSYKKLDARKSNRNVNDFENFMYLNQDSFGGGIYPKTSSDEEDWDNVLRTGLDLGGGPVQSQELFKALQRRVERTLMRTENGSYQQRILVEYLRGIETRAQTLVEAFQASPPSPSA
jgi:hypothetical protein